MFLFIATSAHMSQVIQANETGKQVLNSQRNTKKFALVLS